MAYTNSFIIYKYEPITSSLISASNEKSFKSI